MAVGHLLEICMSLVTPAARRPALPSAAFMRHPAGRWCAAALAGLWMTAGAQASAQLCGGEPMPVLEAPYVVQCALDRGIQRDTAADQSDAISAALASLVSAEQGLFFPKGRYVVNKTLTLRTGNSLVGSVGGETMLVNTTGQRVQITENVAHSAKKLLVEGLTLEDIHLNSFHIRGDATFRYNVLIGGASAEPLITANLSKQVIHGNVLLRPAGSPGIGLQTNEGRSTRVTGNLIGSGADLQTVGAFVDGRTVELAQRIFARRPDLQQRGGFFTRAWEASNLNKGVFQRNAVVLNDLEALPVGSLLAQNGHAVITSAGNSVAAPVAQRLAQLRTPTELRIADNYFHGAADASSPTALVGAPVVLTVPDDVTISGNTFDHAGVRVTQDPARNRPVKRTAIVNNGFYGAHVSLQVPVNGSGSEHTAPEDVVVLGNYFHVSDNCAMDAPQLTVGTRNFFAADNLDLSRKPVPVCRLTSVSRDEALQSLSAPAFTDAGKRRVVFDDGEWRSEDVRQDAAGRPLTAFVVPAQPGATGPQSVVPHASAPASVSVSVRPFDGGPTTQRRLEGRRFNGCAAVAMNDDTACTPSSNQLVLQAADRPYRIAAPRRGLMRVTAVGPHGALDDETYTLIELEDEMSNVVPGATDVVLPPGTKEPTGNGSSAGSGGETRTLPPVDINNNRTEPPATTTPKQKPSSWNILQLVVERLILKFKSFFS